MWPSAAKQSFGCGHADSTGVNIPDQSERGSNEHYTLADLHPKWSAGSQ
jgi:hypothetical protein